MVYILYIYNMYILVISEIGQNIVQTKSKMFKTKTKIKCFAYKTFEVLQSKTNLIFFTGYQL